jgi:beta-xylosidase
MSAAARSRVLAGLVLSIVALVLVSLLPDQPAFARERRANPVGSDRFSAGRYYRGDFPDPAVLKVGRSYYAYSTTMSSLNLPVMVSTDLTRWRAVGEGLLNPASWAVQRRSGGRRVATTWAPSVVRTGSTYAHAYATQVRGVTPRKMCISVSRSTRPMSGYVDRTRRPVVCPSTRGAIDPQYFRASNGILYMLWKSEQTNGYRAQLWITRVTSDGTRLGRPNHLLLTASQPWERGIIENPSMIGYRGRWYLFYSGGSYADDSYATGYAICRTIGGPCTRAETPLLTTGGSVSGPGGAMAFYDNSKRLRLAYAAWDFGRSGYPTSTTCLMSPLGCNQRRLHVATVGLDPTPGVAPGTLTVTSRG